MKRSWIGCGMLLILLALCLAIGWALDRFQAPVTRELDRAAACAREENWLQAKVLAEEAQNQWEHCRGKLACVADHTPMEEIDELFARLSCYAEEKEEYAATCVSLSQRIRAVADAHSLTWWNFF